MKLIHVCFGVKCGLVFGVNSNFGGVFLKKFLIFFFFLNSHQ